MHILIVGASGGIGAALLSHLLETHPQARFIATRHLSDPSIQSDRVHWLQCDVSKEEDIANLAEQCEQQLASLTWCINAVGLLHDEHGSPEKSIRRLDAEFFLSNMSVNALPTLLLAKHLLPLFDKTTPTLFATVSAKVGSIEDNRLGGWHSYRCSKAALNMALKTLSIELALKMPKLCVAAIHPGTTKTRLSKPFTSRTPEEKLFSPEFSANKMATTLSKLSAKDTGQFWSWDGSNIPW